MNFINVSSLKMWAAGTIIANVFLLLGSISAAAYQAAVTHPNGKVYFFDRDKYYRFDFQSDNIVGIIGVDGWKGLPANVDIATEYPNGKAYFFPGD